MPKHKLKRFAENLTFDNLFQVSYEMLEKEPFKHRGHWREYFGNDAPLCLELGCGKGEYTINLARIHPDRNYIGVDIKGARLWRGAKTATEEQMPNVAFIRTRIELIERFFAQDEVDEIWITFPDPQPKKPKKRLTSECFISRYKKFMRPGGTIHLKTDSQELYDYTLNEVIPENGYTVVFNTPDLYSTQYDGEAKLTQTFYESMWLAQGKAITYIQFKI
ncbi:MAG: tRNA (guanosine(46)-N7)-methyltransferase TrmB [Bacteroidales bacterium]|nr:tRNA (guanosine(46)-N7)-methyltransferase TrmB [Bacteroidales bacterium]